MESLTQSYLEENGKEATQERLESSTFSAVRERLEKLKRMDVQSGR